MRADFQHALRGRERRDMDEACSKIQLGSMCMTLGAMLSRECFLPGEDCSVRSCENLCHIFGILCW